MLVTHFIFNPNWFSIHFFWNLSLVLPPILSLINDPFLVSSIHLVCFSINAYSLFHIKSEQKYILKHSHFFTSFNKLSFFARDHKQPKCFYQYFYILKCIHCLIFSKHSTKVLKCNYLLNSFHHLYIRENYSLHSPVKYNCIGFFKPVSFLLSLLHPRGFHIPSLTRLSVVNHLSSISFGLYMLYFHHLILITFSNQPSTPYSCKTFHSSVLFTLPFIFSKSTNTE